jgi:hypothetical protein
MHVSPRYSMHVNLVGLWIPKRTSGVDVSPAESPKLDIVTLCKSALSAIWR